MPVQQKTIEANGIRFAYLEVGDGPLMLLLHGFPDDARTWSNQMEAFAAAGYRVVAPFLRGYPRTDVPTHGTLSPQAHCADVEALIHAFDGAPATVIGHDWGALATFNVCARAPGLVERAITVGGSHPATLLGVFERPALAHYVFHIWFFQLEGQAEAAVRANDLAFIDYLWDQWSADGFDDPVHLSAVKETLSQPGVVEALLSYYRALVRLPFDDTVFLESALRKTSVPMLCTWGASDPARVLAEGEEAFFTGRYQRAVLDAAAHFAHREQPAAFNETVLSWLARDLTERE